MSHEHEEKAAFSEEAIQQAEASAPPPAKPKKEPAEVLQVFMQDGRTVAFTGKRKMLKECFIDDASMEVKARFDFRNGETRTIVVPDTLILRCAGHGVLQKIGDETAGVEEIDDMVIAVDETIAHLNAGEWSVARQAGDGFSGASVVIKAICEVTGKSIEHVKKFLQDKLDTAKAKGEKLSRAELYASFRNPKSKTGVVIERLERDKKAKESKVSADDLLGELA